MKKTIFVLLIFSLFSLLILSACGSPIGQVVKDTGEETTSDNEIINNNLNTQQNDISPQTQEDNTKKPNQEFSSDAQKIKIANWNLKIFGDTKASNSELMQTYSSIIDDYDIIFIQEIRNKDQTAFPKLCNLLPNYECKASSRAGRSTSKEQYGVIYKKGIEISNWNDFNPDSQDRWERPPLEVTFNIGGYSLKTYNIHIKPTDVNNEINYLEDVVSTSGNVMVLGDLNADCKYYNPLIQTEFDSWNWIIKDSEDTTVSKTDCAYDRIILNSDAYGEFSSYGIFKEGINDDVSDHYLVWIELKLDDVVIDFQETQQTNTPEPKEDESEPTQEDNEPEDDNSNYICNSDYYNCGDFNTHAEAQAVFEACGGVSNDIHRLDRNNDGVACESLP